MWNTEGPEELKKAPAQAFHVGNEESEFSGKDDCD
jgi:hypothetical protein